MNGSKAEKITDVMTSKVLLCLN